jgi:hypothetical protein
MSLNNIELGDLVVSELYPNSLLATEAAIPTKARISVNKIAVGPGLPSGSAPVTTTLPAPETSAPVSTVTRTTTTPEAKTPQTAPAGPNQPVTPSTASGQGTAPITRTSPVPGSDGGYKVLGNNRRQITILVQSPGVAFLADDQLSFLTRMLEACKMNVGDVAIVNTANAAVTITALKQQLQPKIILLFGMEPVAIKLPMSFPWFKIQAYDECTYLCAPSLEQLVLPGDESKLMKSKLWMCLKTLFAI